MTPFEHFIARLRTARVDPDPFPHYFLGGSGALTTFRIHNEAQLAQVVQLIVELRFVVDCDRVEAKLLTGYVTIRHVNESLVHDGLDLIDRTIKIAYTSSDSTLENPEAVWAERLHNYRSLTTPAWEATL